ncbi:MAG: hypothetical protein RH946_11655 [Rhodospirillales bacterium]
MPLPPSENSHGRTVVVYGDDKIGRAAAARLKNKKIRLVADQSGGFWRGLRMILRRRISIANAAVMFIADLCRKDLSLCGGEKINSNAQLAEVVTEYKASRIILFRASLIIDLDLLPEKTEVINIHCISIDNYPGLGAIWRALGNKDLDQFATAHQVTSVIDCGKIIDTEPYAFKSENSYAANENIAYEAGIRLLLRLVTPVDGEET